eukprot:7157538-Alexandrium_andersonii.AAC.1
MCIRDSAAPWRVRLGLKSRPAGWACGPQADPSAVARRSLGVPAHGLPLIRVFYRHFLEFRLE